MSSVFRNLVRRKTFEQRYFSREFTILLRATVLFCFHQRIINRFCSVLVLLMELEFLTISFSSDHPLRKIEKTFSCGGLSNKNLLFLTLGFRFSPLVILLDCL